MAKGLPQHTGDPQVEVGSYETVPDGNYTINGIDSFLPNCLDPNGNPTFTPILGELKVSMKLRRSDGGEGLAHSATPAEFLGLVLALGGTLDGVTAKNRTASDTLVMLKDRANNGGRKLSVSSRNGWVNRIPQACPPEGKYTVEFTDAHRTDFEAGNYHFSEIKGKNGTFESLIFDFVIKGDGQGKPTLWDGFTVGVFFNNAFCESYEDSKGRTISATEMGIPLYSRDTRSGGILQAARKWELFARYFAPDLANHDWKMENSPYGINEVLEPQYVFIHYAKAAKNAVRVYYKDKSRNGRGRTIDMLDLPLVNDTEPEPMDVDDDQQPEVLDELLSYITKKWPEKSIFDQSDPQNPAVVFTDDGRAWAREYMGGDNGPWKATGLPEGRALHTLDETQLTALYQEFVTRYGPVAEEEETEEGW